MPFTRLASASLPPDDNASNREMWGTASELRHERAASLVCVKSVCANVQTRFNTVIYSVWNALTHGREKLASCYDSTQTQRTWSRVERAFVVVDSASTERQRLELDAANNRRVCVCVWNGGGSLSDANVRTRSSRVRRTRLHKITTPACECDYKMCPESDNMDPSVLVCVCVVCLWAKDSRTNQPIRVL